MAARGRTSPPRQGRRRHRPSRRAPPRSGARSRARARCRLPDARGVVGAPEAVEDPLLVLGRDAGALVGDGEPRPAVELAVREPDARALRRDADGVVEQVRDRPLEHVPVALDDPAGNDGDARCDPRCAAAAAANSSRASSSSAASGTGSRPEAGASSRASASRSSVSRAIRSIARLITAAAVARLSSVASGVGEREVEVRLDDRERRAQLVRRVGDEAPLRRERRGRAGEHRVERVGEPLQLVVGPVERDPARQLARLDLARHLRDAVRSARARAPRPPSRPRGWRRRARRARRARSVRRLRSVRSFTCRSNAARRRASAPRPAAVVDGHLLEDRGLRDRLVAQAEREPEVERPRRGARRRAKRTPE